MKKLVFEFLIILTLSITANAKYSGGSGTAGDPYRIANVADLLALAADTDDYDKHFILIADIDLDPNLPGRQVFTTAVIAPTYDAYFTGTFDGRGHKILNLAIENNNEISGLFGYVWGGDINNLRLENINIKGPFGIGALAVDDYEGTIKNCSSTGIIIGETYIGGLVASLAFGEIVGCHSEVNIISSGDYSGEIGGLAGSIEDTSIRDCYATGTIIVCGNNSEKVGGLVGRNNGPIDNCYSSVNITVARSSEYIGGLVGENASIISDCCSTAIIYCGDFSFRVGGLVGGNGGSIINCSSNPTINRELNAEILGGLVGENINGIVSNCFSSGYINGSGIVGGLVGLSQNGDIKNCYSICEVDGWGGGGGLVGYNYGGDINHCYSTGTVSECGGEGGLAAKNSGSINSSYFLDTSGPDNGYGEPLTDEQMKQQASFVGWDFVWESVNGPNDIWAICEDVNYPKLAWQYIVGDSDNDKDVDFVDFAPLGLKWLQTDPHLYCGGSDLTGDGLVNLEDLDAFVENWLQ